MHRGDLKPQAGQRPPDQIHIGRVRPVLPGQLLAGQDGGALDQHRREARPAAQHQRQLGPLGGVQPPGLRGGGERRALAACQLDQRMGFFRHGPSSALE